MSATQLVAAAAPSVDLSWYAPNQTSINSLSSAINGTGVYNFIFNSSSNTPYGGYDWCDMPHVRRKEYVPAPAGFIISYAEVIHRHHKRTPYQSNTFPVEEYSWDCSDSNLYYYAANPKSNHAPAQTYWEVFQDSSNPYSNTQGGYPNSNCEFPQITGGGLQDSFQHGVDLWGVYHDLLHLIPNTACNAAADSSASKVPNQPISFRVTNNVITSEVAGSLIGGMCGAESRFPLLIQPSGVDSLEPSYSCGYASYLYGSYGVGSSAPNWTAHLTDAAPLFAKLDSVSGINPTDNGWHRSFDHYFDSLSARLCHNKPLPCNIQNSSNCITQNDANEVFRLGEYEYSFIYRDSPLSLNASTASFGAWIAELSTHLRAVIAGEATTVYRHNVAHDGSMSRLLSILQVNQMVWPGMGSEVVFELYQLSDVTKSAFWAQVNGQAVSIGKSDKWFVRVLWGGQVLVSSSPTLGRMDMIPSSRLLAYFDGLVGKQASLVVGLCNQ